MPPITPGTLAKSPERKVFEAYVEHLRDDETIAALFDPILAVETPTLKAFLSYGTGSMAVQPVPPKPDDHPSSRSTSRLAVHISAYLPPEQREENSECVGLDLGGYLRKITWGLTLADPDNLDGVMMNFATTSFRQLPSIMPADGATRILTYEVVFELDVDPTTNDFSG